MTSGQMWENIQEILNKVVNGVFNPAAVVTFIIVLVFAYLVNRLLSFVILKLARFISRAGDTAATSEKRLRLRRLETYISIVLALMRFGIFAIAVVVAWEYTHPGAAPAAIIASGTIFIVMAGATIVPMLRDLTAGSIMIAEQWYTVGDYITVDPFNNISGVVERMNLRSTKIRSLTGEVIWIHNQNIQGVRVTPRGVRTIAIDIFVNNLEKGKKLIEEVASTLPVEPMMLAAPLRIVDTAKLGTRLWQITAISEVTPGREWLLENFACEAIKENDKKNGKTIAYGPIAYNDDPDAERRFKQTIRMKTVGPMAPVKPTSTGEV
jgi:small conductance mechanosensitive channel